MKVLSPRGVDEALAMLAESAARGEAVTPIAGGTDVMVSWHHREKNGLTLLDLSRVRALAVMEWIRAGSGTSLTLGGLTTYWDVMQSREAASAYPLLGEAARQVGAVQIQTRGTWAGNIGNGSPAADGVPVLMAYDARVVLASVRGRREVRLDEFYTGYRTSVRAADELIVAIRLPPTAWDVQWFHKVGARRAQAITKVGVALSHGSNGWRVVANSVAPTVVRCRALEAALNAGRTFNKPAEIESILSVDISPIDDLRSSAAYRRRVLARLIYFRLAEGA